MLEYLYQPDGEGDKMPKEPVFEWYGIAKEEGCWTLTAYNARNFTLKIDRAPGWMRFGMALEYLQLGYNIYKLTGYPVLTTEGN